MRRRQRPDAVTIAQRFSCVYKQAAKIPKRNDVNIKKKVNKASTHHHWQSSVFFFFSEE